MRDALQFVVAPRPTVSRVGFLFKHLGSPVVRVCPRSVRFRRPCNLKIEVQIRITSLMLVLDGSHSTFDSG